MTPTKLKALIDNLIEIEGGYVNDPRDAGGETKYGITKKVALAHGYTGRMQDLPRELAFDIYYADYISGPRFDQVFAAGYEMLAEELIDTGVNMGPSKASEFLQDWLTALNNQGKLYPDLVVDGAIGPRTISALKSLGAHRGVATTDKVLTSACNSSQAVRYLQLAKGKESQEAFLWGWLVNRAVL